MSNTTYKDKCLLPDCLGRATAESPSLDLPRRCQCIHNAPLITSVPPGGSPGKGRRINKRARGIHLLSETLLIIMGLNFQKDLKSQNHILDTFMHSIKKVMTYFNVLAEA